MTSGTASKMLQRMHQIQEGTAVQTPPKLVLKWKMQCHRRNIRASMPLMAGCRGIWHQSSCTSWIQKQQRKHSDVVIPHQVSVLVFLHSPSLGCLSQLVSLPPDWHTDIFQDSLQGVFFSVTQQRCNSLWENSKFFPIYWVESDFTGTLIAEKTPQDKELFYSCN